MAYQKNYFNSTRISMIALFGALAGVLYAFGFAMPFAFPSFLELNFSDIPVLIGTFALGPLSGACIVVVKILLKLIIKSTGTVFVGELADLLIGLAFALPAGFFYRKFRTFKGALLSLVIGSFSSVFVAVLVNWLMLVPFYVTLFFGGSWEPLVEMMTPLFPTCTKENFYTFYLWVSVLPFNLMRCLIASLITLPVYKRVSREVNKLNERLAPKKEAGTRGRVITVFVVSAVLLLLIGGVLLRYFLMPK